MSTRHLYVVDECFEALGRLSYPNTHFLYFDTSTSCDFLKNYIPGFYPFVEVRKWKWNDHPFGMMRDIKREFARIVLEEDYDYWLCVDVDTIITEDSLSRLVEQAEENLYDVIGMVQPHGWCKLKQPCVMKDFSIKLGSSGWMSKWNWYDWDEIKQLDGETIKCAYCGVSPTLFSRNVLKNVKWEFDKEFMFGEDIRFLMDCYNKGIDVYCDTSLQAQHKNTAWENLITKKWEKPTGKEIGNPLWNSK